MALTKITSRILDSSGVTILGTIATGVWQGTPINQTYLVGQSGTNTGDETLARINALDVTELGTVSSGVWQGSVITEAYLQNQSGTNTGDQTTISGNAGTVTNGVYTTGNQTIGGVKTFSSNVGINATISSIWSTSYNALQIGLNGSIYAHNGGGSAIRMASNVVYEGTAPNYYDKYLTTSTATKYQQDAGSHIWSTAASGSANAVIPWSERMRIDGVTGNVGIGTASNSSYPIAPQLVLDTGTSNGGITIKSGSSNYSGVYFADGTTGNEQYRGYIQYNHNYSGSVDELVFGTQGTTKLTISSGGTATFSGTIIPSSTDSIRKSVNNSLITISGGNATNAGANYSLFGGTHSTLPNIHRWRIGASEVMRISSGGDVILNQATSKIIGGGTTAGRFVLQTSAGGNAGGGTYMVMTGSTYPTIPNTTYFVNNSVERMRITSGGDVLINATSKHTGYTAFTTLKVSSNSGDYFPILEFSGNRDANNGNQNAMIQFWNKTSTAVEVGRITSSQASGVNYGDLQFATASNGTLTERMRIRADGDINITGGGRILSSGGIYLGTNNNVNLLNYYEEGTWTGTMVNDGVGNTATGTYVRIGKLVQIQIYFSNKNVTASGSATVSGLPYSSSGSGNVGYGIISYLHGNSILNSRGAYVNGTSFFAITNNSLSQATWVTGNKKGMFVGTYNIN